MNINAQLVAEIIQYSIQQCPTFKECLKDYLQVLTWEDFDDVIKCITTLTDPACYDITKKMIIKRLGYHTLTDDPFECTICQNYRYISLMRKIPCGHVFDIHCLDQWLMSGHITCPLCRQPIISEEGLEYKNYNHLEMYINRLYRFFGLFYSA
jgi:hypothetical protein